MSKKVSLEIKLPLWGNWIAEDSLGCIRCYQFKPSLNAYGGWDSDGPEKTIGHTISNAQWRESLQEVVAGEVSNA